MEIREVEACTSEIKSRKILALEVKPGEWAGCVRLRGKLPDKSQIFKLFCVAGLARRDVAVDVMLVLSGGALTPSAGIVDYLPLTNIAPPTRSATRICDTHH